MGPLLEKYGVTVYVAGHEHEMQVFKDNGVMYIVTGTGDRCTSDRFNRNKVPQGSLIFDYEMPYQCDGFLSITVSPEGMDFHFYRGQGKLVHSTPLGPVRPRSRVDSVGWKQEQNESDSKTVSRAVLPGKLTTVTAWLQKQTSEPAFRNRATAVAGILLFLLLVAG